MPSTFISRTDYFPAQQSELDRSAMTISQSRRLLSLVAVLTG